ncbi:MAG: cytochrome b [Burkholderiales bacterium]|nr:cytochrome b [Burkholderiales bacterium]
MAEPASAPPAARYNATAVALHWLLAVMLTVSFSVGWFMSDLPFSIERLKLFNWHKWAGITILALSLLRLLWRLTHRPPPALPGPRWQLQAARVGHGLMYALFLAVPLAGWGYSSAAGFPVVLFGVLPLPDFVAPDRTLASTLKSLHGTLAWTLAAVVALHVAAALKHHFIDRDGLLLRMRPGRP